MAEATAIDWIRASNGAGLADMQLVRAIAPLLEQLAELHATGRVGPLDRLEHVHATDGRLWFRLTHATNPELSDLTAIRTRPSRTGVEVVSDGSVEDCRRPNVTRDLHVPGAPVAHPVYLAGYRAWELELGHHDALTDIFVAGLMFASLATGLDFTHPDQLQRFILDRHRLASVHSGLHPVLARAIVRMTELDRHERVADLGPLIDRIRHHRDVDERLDTRLDFDAIEGFVTADRRSRRKRVQSVLQSRLFDISRRNRLIHHRPTRAMLDLTLASVPTRVPVGTIDARDLFLWVGPAGRALASGTPIRLERYLRFEESPWIKGALDEARRQDRRSRAEVGFSQLRLVLAFLDWHDLSGDREERIRSPLLLLPVELTQQRGVRTITVLSPRTEHAEVNPVLRHRLSDLYGLDLPDEIDLTRTDIDTFHEVLAATIRRSEPAVTLHKLVRPQIPDLQETSRHRTDTWRRRSRRLRTALGVDYSYSRGNFRPLGAQLYERWVKPVRQSLAQHLEATPPTASPAGSAPLDTTERQVVEPVESAAGPHDWAVDLTHCTLGNFNYRKMSLVRDYDQMLAEEDGEGHPGFDTLFSIEHRPVDSPPPEPRDVELFNVVPADPSQAASIHRARLGESLIIQGPPGTGKSQTITNLIADFAARGKRVLFVCQKRAALDVVYHRLTQHGLDELSVLVHDAAADKKAFLADLSSVYERWARPARWEAAEPERQLLLDELRAATRTLEAIGFAWAEVQPGTALPVHQLLSEHLRLGPGPKLPDGFGARLPDHATWTAHRDTVLACGAALRDAGQSPILARSALATLSREALSPPSPQRPLAQGLHVLEAALDAVEQLWSDLDPAAAPDTLPRAMEAADHLALLLPDHLALADPVSDLSRTWRHLLANIATAQRAHQAAIDANPHWREPLDAGDTTTALALATRFQSMFFLFAWLHPSWWKLRSMLVRRFAFEAAAVAPGWVEVLERNRAQQAAAAAVQTAREQAVERFRFTGGAEAFELKLQRLRRFEGLDPRQVQWIRSWIDTPSRLQPILQARSSVRALMNQSERLFHDGGRSSAHQIRTRIGAVRETLDLLPRLQTAFVGLGDIPDTMRLALSEIDLATEHWEAAVISESWRRIRTTDRIWTEFDHARNHALTVALSHGHHRLHALNARVVRERVRTRFRTHLDLSTRANAELRPEELAFKRRYAAGRKELEREFGKVMRHKSIRSLATGDSGSVVYDLKPIWLMSPLSISDTIPMDTQRFDVVIFDEASQIPVEEAVPAVYRAPQMIVVGDEMQLPPTRFFSSTSAVDLADEELAEVHYDLDAESFLSHSARRLPSTLLSWHYRSRHETLIRFSNHAFYEGELNTIPDRTRPVERDAIVVRTPTQGDDHAPFVVDRPISHHRLMDAPYASRVNPKEAAYIARLVRGLIRARPLQTLGVVAFSEAQQGAIERAVDQLADADPRFRREFEAATELVVDGQMAGLFIKNLENVQGDERDVILLSICYGPGENGRMRMNFGPINKGGGEKRLNVVFSRARSHLAVVTSIRSTDITNLYNDGARCLAGYLRYAEAASTGDDRGMEAVTRSLARAGDGRAPRLPDPLVDQLEGALLDAGWVVERDVGASAFSVDLAVGTDEDNELRVAVVVDRPQRWSGGTTAELKHFRPSVLRASGWTVVTILPTDWLHDPDQVLERIRRAVLDPNAARFPSPPEIPDEPEPTGWDTTRPVDPDAPIELNGATVLLTGTFQGSTRAMLRDRLLAVGARVATALTRRTTFVFAGSRPGSKARAARRAGVPVFDQATLFDTLDAAESSPSSESPP